jgi:hypothetical protein
LWTSLLVSPHPPSASASSGASAVESGAESAFTVLSSDASTETELSSRTPESALV